MALIAADANEIKKKKKKSCFLLSQYFCLQINFENMHGRESYPTYSSKRSKSPFHHMERSNSPSRHMQRRESPTRYFEKNYHPHYYSDNEPASWYLERSMSPSHYSERYRYRSHHLERSRSPHHLERGRSPPYLERNRSSSHHLERSRSDYLERNRSPYHHLERSWSPHYFERNRSPSHDLERSRSHYLERNRSSFNSLPKSNSPSHSVDRSESPYFGERERPFHYPQRVESPDHYSINCKSPQYLMRSRSHSPLLDDELLLDTSEIEEHADAEQHNDDEQHSSNSIGQHTLKKITPKSSYKVKSLEEVDRMTDEEINALRLKGASLRKLRTLLSQRASRVEAKRTIIKENFIRNRKKQLSLKSETFSISQSHIISLDESADESPVSQFTKGEVKSELGESSSSQDSDILVQMSSKRNISEARRSPNPNNKKPKIEDSTEKVAVFYSDYPIFRLEIQKLTLTKNAIMSVYERLPAAQGPQVRFESYQFKPGYLLVTCADELSANWLKNTVPPLKPWKGAVLQAIAEEAVSKGVKCQVFVPNENKVRLSKKRILNRLRIGNKGLNSHLWSVVRRQPVEKGQLWTFAMGKESLEALKMLNMRPYYGLRRLKFRVFKPRI